MYLPVYSAILLLVFVGYLLAAKERYAVVGATIAAVAAAAIYGWCTLWFPDPFSPFLLVLVAPALFRIASVRLQRAAARQEASMRSQEEQRMELHDAPSEDAKKEREMAVGAA